MPRGLGRVRTRCFFNRRCGKDALVLVNMLTLRIRPCTGTLLGQWVGSMAKEGPAHWTEPT